MSEERHPIQISDDTVGGIAGQLQIMVRQLRLTWRLFWDKRVPLWTKIVPPATLTYLLFPFDISPDALPILGQLDDVAILFLGVKLFVYMAPIEIVREHLRDMGIRIQEWHSGDESDDVVEGEYQLTSGDED